MPSFAGGGAETAMVRLSRHWSSVGQEVAFVVNSAEGPLVEKLHPATEVIDLGALATRRAFPRLRSWLAERQPRLLVSVLYHNAIAAAAALRLASPRTAHVALLRNHTTAELEKVRAARRSFEKLALRLALRSADRVGCVSETVAADAMALSGLGSDRVRVTYNPVPLPDRPAFNAPPGWPDSGRKVLVGVGRLEPQKDYPTLLQAVAHVRERVPVELVILGKGRQLAELQALSRRLGIEDHVYFLGFVSQPEAYVARADALVLTSLYEGFPNVIAEALSLGTTVVATDAPGGSAEILENGRLGYLAEVGDAHAVADAIVRALQAPIDPERLRARARDFDTAAIAARYEALFAEALERKAKR